MIREKDGEPRGDCVLKKVRNPRRHSSVMRKLETALDPLLYIRRVQDGGVAVLDGAHGSFQKAKRLTAPGAAGPARAAAAAGACSCRLLRGCCPVSGLRAAASVLYLQKHF